MSQETQKEQQLKKAIEDNDVETARTLLAAKASLDSFVETADQDGEAHTWMPILHHVVEKNHIEMVKLLLENKASQAPGPLLRRTPLYSASQAGRVEMVKALLKAHADPCSVLPFCGRTPLHFAAKHSGNNTAVMSALLDAKADVNAFAGGASLNTTSLHRAITASSLANVRFLLEAKASITEQDKDGNTALASTINQLLLQQMRENRGHTPNPDARQNKLAILKELLKVEGKEAATQPDKFKALCLIAQDNIIAQDNMLAAVKLLLESKANPNEKDPDGLTPLTLAYGANNTETITTLLDSKAELQEDVVLAYVMHKKPDGHIKLAQKLIDKRATVDGDATDTDSSDMGKKNAIQCAAANGDVAGIQFLLEQKASLETKDESLAPLTLAAMNRKVAAVQFLLDHKAKPQSCTVAEFLEGPQHLLVDEYLRTVPPNRDTVTILTLLLAAKADPNGLNLAGNNSALTAFQRARSHPHQEEIISLLLTHNANPNIRVGEEKLSFLEREIRGGRIWISPLLDKISKEFIKQDQRRNALLSGMHYRAGQKSVLQQALTTYSHSDPRVLRVISRLGGVQHGVLPGPVSTKPKVDNKQAAQDAPAIAPPPGTPTSTNNTLAPAAPLHAAQTPEPPQNNAPQKSRGYFTPKTAAFAFFTAASWGWGSAFTAAAAGEKIKLFSSICFAAQIALASGLLLLPIAIAIAVKYQHHKKIDAATLIHGTTH